MKRKLLAAALVLLATLMIGGVAFAVTDPIVCSMEVSPSNLTEPGDVTVTITVSNSGETDMTDPLTLYSPTSEVVKDFGDNGSVTLKAGEVKTWSGKWSVNKRTLDNGQIVFFVKYFLYKDDGTKEAQSQPIRGKLNATEAKTDIEIKRTISPGTAREGQTVTVKYDIVNNGTVSLKNITLTENKDISKKAVSVAEELKAGETAQVKLTVTMGKKDLTSNATITYTTADSKDKQTKTVAEQKITYGEAAMTAKLTSSSKGVEVNGTVTLKLELKNNGSVNYTDVRVTDATLGDVFTNQELAAGATLKLEKEITLTQTTDYQFTITAIDNTGTEVSLSTDALTLTAVDPGKTVHLNVTAAADRTEVYTQPGIVRFTVTVENDSQVDAANVMIYHGTTKIYTIPSIPAGESRKLTRDASLSMEGKYQFTAVVVDALDNSNKFNSNEIQIAFSVPTPAPLTPTPPAVPTPEPTYAKVTLPPISDPNVGTLPKTIRTFFYPLMIVGIVLLLGAAVLLIAATKKRVEQKKASEAALDHLDRAKRRDYVAPSEEQEEEPEPATKSEPRPTAKPQQTVARPKTTAPEEQPPADDVELPHMKYVRNAYQRSGKNQSDAYGKKSIYDDDPLTGTAGFESTAPEAEEPYHTYGNDQDFYDQPPVATGKAKSGRTVQNKDWSAYSKRPETGKPEANGYAPDRSAYRRGAESPEAPAENGDAAPYSDTLAAYDDYTAYPEGTDAYAGDQPGYEGQDGYAADPLGYGGQAGYEADQPGYDNGQPGYGDASAAYNESQADYAQPDYDDGQPVYDDAHTGYENTQPGYSGYTPEYGGDADYPAATDDATTAGGADAATAPSKDTVRKHRRS